MGTTSITPNSEATQTIIQKASICPGSSTSQPPRPIQTNVSKPLKNCWPGNWINRLSTSINLKKATRLPQKVTVPMRPEAAVETVN